MLSVYNILVIVCLINPTVGMATALPAHYVPVPLETLTTDILGSC